MKRQLLPLRGTRTLIALCAALALVISVCAAWCVADAAGERIPASAEVESTDSSSEPAGDNSSSSEDEEDPASSESSSEDPDESSSDETSSDETSSDETPSDETSSDETSSDETSFDETSSGDTSFDETSSDEDSSDETPSEPSEPEEPAAAYKVTLQVEGDYEPEGVITITAAVEDLDDALDVTGFFFDVRYDTDAMTLTNAIGEDNIVDCVTRKPNDRWENLTKLGDVPGTLRVAVAAAETLVPASAEPEDLEETEVIGSVLTLSLQFRLAEDLPESAVLSVSDVIAMDGESVSREGLGTVLTLTQAEDNTDESSEPDESADPDESSDTDVSDDESSDPDESSEETDSGDESLEPDTSADGDNSDTSVPSDPDESSAPDESVGGNGAGDESPEPDESSEPDASSQPPASSEPPAASDGSSTAPETGDIGILFPFLLGTGGLLGLLTAVRLRRKADSDPARK